MEFDCIITFDTMSYVLKFEKVLKQNNIKVQLKPVPREFSSSCGTCGAIYSEDLEKALNICKSEKIRYDEIFQLNK